MAFAQQEFDRANALVARGFAANELLDRRQQALNAAIAALNAANDRVGEAERALDATAHDVEHYHVNIADNPLVAPREGRIQYRFANVGEAPPAGGRVFAMLDVMSVSIDIYVPAADAGTAKIGADARRARRRHARNSRRLHGGIHRPRRHRQVDAAQHRRRRAASAERKRFRSRRRDQERGASRRTLSSHRDLSVIYDLDVDPGFERVRLYDAEAYILVSPQRRPGDKTAPVDLALFGETGDFEPSVNRGSSWFFCRMVDFREIGEGMTPRLYADAESDMCTRPMFRTRFRSLRCGVTPCRSRARHHVPARDHATNPLQQACPARQ